MKKATIILAILFSALNTHIDAQNLTKEQCLKYILDLINTHYQTKTTTLSFTAENIRLEYNNLRFDIRNKDGVSPATFNLSGLIISKEEDDADYLSIRNLLGQTILYRSWAKSPSQKDRLERMLKALKYLSQFAIKDPFGN